MRRTALSIAILFWLTFAGCKAETRSHDRPPASAKDALRRPEPAAFAFSRPEHRFGTHFEADTARFLKSPRLTEIELPDRPGAHAIWSSTGRDDAGRIYFGVASYGIDNPSAYLLRFDPDSESIVDLGDVNRKLDELGQRKFDGFDETQMKIHSKICQAGDGKLYFSSQDEHDEAGDGSRNPRFGGRLFRIDPQSEQWEGLLSTPQALIAVATTGRFVYALGYFGHMLYRFDTRDASVKSIEIGSYQAHISRNFVVDAREHAFVVRVRRAAIDETGSGISDINGVRVKSTLVELDTELQQVNEWPLDDYEPTGDTESHGITAFCSLANQQIVFVTHTGALWLLTYRAEEDATQLLRLGWFHPSGKTYCASLFCPTGNDWVFGFASKYGGGYEWIAFDLANRQSAVMELDEASQTLLNRDRLLIYGSNTIDDQSRAYVVGWKKISRGFGPHVLRIAWDPATGLRSPP